ncbi:MAG: hypothetical protein P8077_07090 [Gammaproteobacteria bacterium]
MTREAGAGDGGDDGKDGVLLFWAGVVRCMPGRKVGNVLALFCCVGAQAPRTSADTANTRYLNA